MPAGETSMLLSEIILILATTAVIDTMAHPDRWRGRPGLLEYG